MNPSTHITFPTVDISPTIERFLQGHSPVAIGVSGGQDSDVAAFETYAYLQSVGHTGSTILVHSDLGRVEHKDSLPACERLATRLGLELVVVRRKSGDLMDRWLVRWKNNVERYAKLACVKVILPWSTASMRFCTSELKTGIICRYLVERYHHRTILNAVGIRRQESTTRALAPICSPQSKLTSKTFETEGYNWHPILSWTHEDVLAYHRYHNFDLHEAYTKYGMTRVSCAYCILGSLADLVASATDPHNHDIYREMVELELISTFSFQSSRWLADVAPHLLEGETLVRLHKAKLKAEARERVERLIPKHLLYTKGWPTVMPTQQEAVLLSTVRKAMAEIMEISVHYVQPDAILARYEELLAVNAHQRNASAQAVVQEDLWSTAV